MRIMRLARRRNPAAFAVTFFCEHVNPQATIGIDFLSKSISHNDRILRLQLWDTAGQVLRIFASLCLSHTTEKGSD